MVWQLLYNLIFIPLGWIGFRLYGLVNRKARMGRNPQTGEPIKIAAKGHKDKDK